MKLPILPINPFHPAGNKILTGQIPRKKGLVWFFKNDKHGIFYESQWHVMACVTEDVCFCFPQRNKSLGQTVKPPIPTDRAKALETRAATSWKRRCLRGKQLWRISKTMDRFKGKFTGNHRFFHEYMAKPVLWIHEYIDPVMCLSPLDIFI